MEVTPPEKHDRTYRQAIEKIKEFSRYPYVEYTEHLAGSVSASASPYLPTRSPVPVLLPIS